MSASNRFAPSLARAALFCAALSLTPIAVHAQDADPDDDDVIIVEGERIETADVRNTARDITVGSQATQSPLSRFQRPVCPGIWGMTQDNAQAVLDRIVFNALQANIPVAEEPDCGANVWVIVVDDAAATFERLQEEDSFLTRHLTSYQERKVRDQDSYALGWNLITTRNPETGVQLPTGWYATQGIVDAASAGLPPPGNEIRSMSRLTLGIRTDIELSVVLVERAALADIDSVALADYATMRLFAYTEPPSEDDPVATVLTLFNRNADDSRPLRMTAFDRAYLRALYRSSPTRPARIALGNISDAMETIDTP
ncbi:hypothetical protein [Aurantiacibacter aquimixticola]|nr:hypothetical protein [Aurantiacibacter aquimixticola]